MAETMTVTVPNITAAVAAPNPVTTGSTILFSITVQMVEKILRDEERMSGEYYAGEG